MMTCAYMLNFTDRMILSVLQEPIKHELGLSDTELGLLSGFSFMCVYVTMGIVLAHVADHWNRRNIVAMSVALWSLMTVLSGFARDFPTLLVARLGVGIGEAGGSPPALSMISDLYSPRRRATAIAVYGMGINAGGFVGNVLGGFISAHWGWRAAFMAVGLPGMLFALAFALTVAEPPRGRWEVGSAANYRPSLREAFALLSRFSSFWLMAFGAGCFALIGYGCGSFNASFLVRVHEMDIGHAGAMLGITGNGAGMPGMLLGGYLADKLGSRDKRWFVLFPLVAGVTSVACNMFFYLLTGVGLALAFHSAASMTGSMGLPSVVAIAHFLVPSGMRALTSATLYFVMNLLGMGGGPLVVGFLSDHLEPKYGNEALRPAMCLVLTMSIPAGLLYLAAAQRLPRDLELKDVATSPLAVEMLRHDEDEGA